MSEYEEIASLLADACSASYSQVWIKAEVKDDWSKQEVWCKSDEGSSQPNVPSISTFKIGQNLRNIRKQMTPPGQEPWSRCTFTLFPDGKFKFDVEYDD